MEYEQIETTLLATVLFDTSYISKFNFDLVVVRDSFQTMLDIARRRADNGEKSIPRPTMLAEIRKNKLGIAEYEVDAVYSKIDEFKFASKETVDDEFYSSHQILKEDQEDKNLKMEFYYAIGLIDEGKRNEAIAHAKGLTFNRKIQLKSTHDLMVDSVDMTHGFKTGVRQIDEEMGGLLKSNLFGLFGDSGAQKTRFSLWFTIQILKANPAFTCLYFEKEMHEKDIANMLVQNLIDVDMPTMLKRALEGDAKREELKDEIREKLKDENDKTVEALQRLTIVPPTDFDSPSDMWEFIDSKQPDIWTLDFLSLIHHIGKDGDSTAAAVRNLETLKQMSLDTQSFGIIINQINKGTAETRKVKIPLMSDVEWGNKMKHFAAYMYSIFRPGHYYVNKHYPIEQSYMSPKDFYVIPQKGRHGSATIPLKSKVNIMDFQEPTEDEKEKMLKWLSLYQQRG